MDLHIPAQISLGYCHTVILNTNNECFVFGSNAQGQLGIDTNPTARKKGEPIKLNFKVEKIFCGYFHTFIRTVDGTCFVSGNNNYGQLGLGHTNEVLAFVEHPVKNLDVLLMGGLHSIFVSEDNKYYACGMNNKQQCCLERSSGHAFALTEIPHDNLGKFVTTSRAKSARK